jgi:signal transduction histidine kinase
MTGGRAGPIFETMISTAWAGIRRWFTRGGVWETGEKCVSPEVVFLRLLGVGYITLMIVATMVTRPHPSLQGQRGVAVLIALCVMTVALVVASPRARTDVRRQMAGMVALIVVAAALAVAQPSGLWEALPIYVAIVAAMRLERKVAAWGLGLTLLVLGIVSGLGNHWGAFLSMSLSAVPWFLVMRQMRRLHDQKVELEVSQAAEARAAAAAERGRLAREMHDVLAHTLSALALQLETTRVLAHDRGVDADVSRAIDQAHGLAASGLEEARRAISTARGDALPGPERVRSLAEAVSEQSGLPVTVDVSGEPRELAPDARLALYRTAQEALTNVRRHATPERVEVRLDYRDDAVALVVEDHGPVGVGALRGLGSSTGREHPGGPAGSLAAGAVASVGAGYGLTGMRERAELLGGTLIAEPTNNGFRVQLVLPG